MSKCIQFIINPNSGMKKQDGLIALIDQCLADASYDYRVTYTERAGHATELAMEAAQAKFDIVAAVGGDGTINEVAKGLIHSDTAMAIVPAGSGNGLARHLNIPLDFEKAIRHIPQGTVIPIDMGRSTHGTFLVVMGIGFDGKIAYEFNQLDTRGFLSYIKTTIKESTDAQEINLTGTIDGQPFDEHFLLMAIANAAQYGNEAKIAPQADVSDGLFDIVFMEKPGMLEIPGKVMQLFKGTLMGRKGITLKHGKHLTFDAFDGWVHLDGEPYVHSGPLEVEVIHHALKVITGPAH